MVVIGFVIFFTPTPFSKGSFFFLQKAEQQIVGGNIMSHGYVSESQYEVKPIACPVCGAEVEVVYAFPLWGGAVFRQRFKKVQALMGGATLPEELLYCLTCNWKNFSIV